MPKRKARVAFITPFATGNVGTALQAHATQHLLDELGYENAVIHFAWKQLENPFCLENLRRRGLVTYLMAIAGYMLRLPKRKGYMNFVSRLRLTRPVDKAALPSLQKEYDFFLAGSDCIWNAEAFAFETAYFLDFVDDPARMGNYASSIASDTIPEAYRADYIRYLSRFPRLCVRETKGQALLFELLGREAEVVLDPTLALPAAYWDTIADESAIKREKPYIFVSEYARSPRLWQEAETLRARFGWEIVSVFPPKGKPLARAHVYWRASPQDFIQLVRHAAFVLTDSYHMTIFSINFNRPFLTCLTALSSATASKYESVMALLGIENRIRYADAAQEGPFAAELPPIDYEAVNAALAREREKSRAYLSSLLAGAGVYTP